jgi:hypothetical protein
MINRAIELPAGDEADAIRHPVRAADPFFAGPRDYPEEKIELCRSCFRNAVYFDELLKLTNCLVSRICGLIWAQEAFRADETRRFEWFQTL